MSFYSWIMSVYSVLWVTFFNKENILCFVPKWSVSKFVDAGCRPYIWSKHVIFILMLEKVPWLLTTCCIFCDGEIFWGTLFIFKVSIFKNGSIILATFFGGGLAGFNKKWNKLSYIWTKLYVGWNHQVHRCKLCLLIYFWTFPSILLHLQPILI